MKFNNLMVKSSLCLLALSLLFASMGFAGNNRLADGVIAREPFSDSNNKEDHQVTAQRGELNLVGSKIEKLKHDYFLRVTQSVWAEYTPPVSLRSAAGTISVWIKPLWDLLDEESHTIFSMQWNDHKKGYLALSQGWWEPAGAGRLYFILNNQEHVHCSLPYKITPEYWTNIAVTWHNGVGGFCRIYIDGKKVAEKQKSFFSSHLQQGPLYLGSDRGATNRPSRGADGFVDDLTIFDYPLNDDEVARLYSAQLKEPDSAQEKRFKWLNEGLKLPQRLDRTKNGTLIETRAIFDEDILWATSRYETDKILTRIKRAGFNVYIPCVWHGKGTYFPSTIARPDPRIKRRIEAGDDPLAYIVEKAHSMGIEVHPWFTVVKRSSDDYPQFYDDGTPDGAFDVHNVGFRQFIVNLMIDMVGRYDVDGVNLDYIRAMGICSSESCRKDYEEKLGHGFWTDFTRSAVSGASRDRLQKWQDEAVGQIVREFSEAAKTINSELVISVDGHPIPKGKVRPLDGRDVVKWVQKGWVDIIFAMDYRERIDFETIDAVSAELNDESQLIALFGNYEKVGQKVLARPGQLVARYAEFAKRKWPKSGVAFYLYGRLSDEQIEMLGEKTFSEPSISRWSSLLERAIKR